MVILLLFFIVSGAVCVAVLLWFIYQYVIRRSFQQEEAERSHWREFAAANQLTFVPGGRHWTLGKSEGAYVIGHYRDHQFKLDTFSRFEPDEKDYTYTRIRVSVNTDPDRVLGQYSGVRHASPQMPNVAASEDDDSSNVDSLSLAEPVEVEVKDVVRQLTGMDLSASGGQVYTLVKWPEVYVYYEQRGIRTDVGRLQSLFDDLSDLADGHARMLALGGEAVSILAELAKITELELRNTIVQLLEGIADDTTKRLGDQVSQLLCPRCLARYGVHRIRLSPLKTMNYYGCRICHQSREFMKVWVVAVVDNAMEPEWLEQAGILQVNWLARRTLFDFDAVAIARATDEEVERFAMQVGNDTDKLRQSGYKRMRCAVAADCELSENTMRILRRMFGEVIIK